MTDRLIRVDEETGAKLEQIATMHGRTLGGQVRIWADSELPKCGHPLTPVNIQTFPTPAGIDHTDIHLRTAWYCKTCKRVYAEA